MLIGKKYYTTRLKLSTLSGHLPRSVVHLLNVDLVFDCFRLSHA